MTDPRQPPTVALPPDHPLFAGHFPGHPLIPGYALLEWIARRDAVEQGTPPRSFTGVRFRRPVGPGSGLTFAIDDDRAFTVHADGELAADGRLDGPPRPETPPGAPAPAEAPRPLSVPHTPPAAFATAVLARDTDSALVAGRVPADHPFTHDGHAPALCALELAAQASAALARDDDPRGPMLLAAVRRLTLEADTLPVETPHPTLVWNLGRAGPLASVGFRVDGIATGRLSFWTELP